MSKLIPQPQPNMDSPADRSTFSAAVFQRTLRKVPEVTVYFWIIKLLTTAMGEVDLRLSGDAHGSDHRGCSRWHGLDGRAGIAILSATLCAMDLLVGRHHGCHIWHNGRRCGYTSCWASRISSQPCSLRSRWQSSSPSGTQARRPCPSIVSTTPRRELFYWATVMATFALGTAAGDMTARTMNLGYFTSGVMFAVLDRYPSSGLLAVGLERDCRLLARLHLNPTARRLICGLGREAAQS